MTGIDNPQNVPPWLQKTELANSASEAAVPGGDRADTGSANRAFADVRPGRRRAEDSPRRARHAKPADTEEPSSYPVGAAQGPATPPTIGEKLTHSGVVSDRVSINNLSSTPSVERKTPNSWNLSTDAADRPRRSGSSTTPTASAINRVDFTGDGIPTEPVEVPPPADSAEAKHQESSTPGSLAEPRTLQVDSIPEDTTFIREYFAQSLPADEPADHNRSETSKDQASEEESVAKRAAKTDKPKPHTATASKTFSFSTADLPPASAARADSGVEKTIAGDVEKLDGLATIDTSGAEYLAPPPALDQSILVNPIKAAPKNGWRRFVYNVTRGYLNLGDSQRALRYEQLIRLAGTPLRGDHRIAVMSLKGGVGKTTTTVMLGGIFASLRGDRVIAIDANPDFGTLAQRAALPGSPTIRDLLNAEHLQRYSQIRYYTTQAESRLEVIGSDRDPEVSEAFSEMDYRHAIDILQHHYNVILTDCGTGLMHSAMAGVLDLANTLILVTSSALDGAQSASATLDWLNHHGYEKLATNAIVVVSESTPGNPRIDIQQLSEHFKSRTRAVQVIPFDRHLAEGTIIDLERLDKRTYLAFLELAGLVAQDFPNWHRHAN
ncbi:hypothetical protein CMUST_14055 [Corynebacterium mustelae]|uniref:CobQ/CobB/MinD/ParA nucleotide binding domain-containing protein n=1 Tax=Corynebacterium mustelae TaxID=571915 RepID=A0A0G3H113_9CORY|nr:hypothetical protein CMUST_14055 [Corynebacterium mustelae]